MVAGMGAHELMELASNLGALDFTTGGPPAADWDINATVGRDGFQPGITVNPSAIIGSLVLGLVALDASLRSMSAPSLSAAVDKYLKKRRQNRLETNLEELEAANALTRATLGGSGEQGGERADTPK